RVEDVDRQSALVEHVGPPDVLDLEGRRLECGRSDGDVTLVLEDAVHPIDILLGLASRFDGEDMVVLVLEVASLVGSQAGERSRHRRRLEADGGNVDEVDCIAHVALPSTSSTGTQPIPYAERVGYELSTNSRTSANSISGRTPYSPVTRSKSWSEKNCRAASS